MVEFEPAFSEVKILVEGLFALVDVWDPFPASVWKPLLVTRRADGRCVMTFVGFPC